MGEAESMSYWEQHGFGGERGLPDLPRVHFGRRWWCNKHTAITLPPFGVWVWAERYIKLYDEDKDKLLRHEAVHWLQYQRNGFFKTYLLYGWYWIRYSAFRGREGYLRNPLEIEARQRSGQIPFDEDEGRETP